MNMASKHNIKNVGGRVSGNALVFLIDMVLSLLTPVITLFFSYTGFAIETVLIIAIYTSWSWQQYHEKISGKINRPAFVKFYLRHAWTFIIPVIIATAYLLHYSGLISNFRQVLIAILVLFDVLFVLSMIFPFARQWWIVKGRDRSLRLDSGVISESLKKKLHSMNISPPLVFVKDLGGRRIANASQVGITRSVIVVTDFLLQNMGKDSLMAIISHEIGHMVNHDIFKAIAELSIPVFLTINAFLYSVIFNGIYSITVAIILSVYLAVDIIFIFPRFRWRSEIEADRFVGEKIGMAENMITSLENLIIINSRSQNYRYKSSRTHPSMDRRIRNLKVYIK